MAISDIAFEAVEIPDAELLYDQWDFYVMVPFKMSDSRLKNIIDSHPELSDRPDVNMLGVGKHPDSGHPAIYVYTNNINQNGREDVRRILGIDEVVFQEIGGSGE
jgi:hypothetical protein